MWAGLGYYSRGKRLWEGAQKVVTELNGEVPQTAEKLMKELPGVGRYTASAIASIAFGEPVGLVDGNVIRVLTRMRRIGADSSSNEVLEAIWTNAGRLVDPEHPGDLNQSLMELGATICTPKLPSCSTCPVADHCRALDLVKKSDLENKGKLTNTKPAVQADIEDCCRDCSLCFGRKSDYDVTDGVANFPRKSKKASQHDRRSLVVVVSVGQKFCLLQRPKSGLLANLLEFPSVEMPSNSGGDDGEVKATKKFVESNLKQTFGVDASDLREIGNVFHQFSHIRQTYLGPML
jgi:A/G-specific adenine glycosylase